MSSPENIQNIYIRIRRRARQIVSQFPLPDFYNDFPLANQFSRHFLETDPIIRQLFKFVTENLEDDFGHGLAHAVKVSRDAGALVITECRQADYNNHCLINRQLRVVQCAGLLHDMRRKEKNHAIAGAEYARCVLESYPFSPEEKENICRAIANHEAFRDTIPSCTPEGCLISDCLYDADKFRWGPDNFKYTVWDMVSFSKVPLAQFMQNYPKGMAAIAKIKKTFRSEIGRVYGPQFIDIGLDIGKKLYKVIQMEFSHLI